MARLVHCYGCYQQVARTTICAECGDCTSCCECHYVRRFNSRLEFHSPKSTQFKHNPSPRFIAAEIEVARIRAARKDVENVIRKWHGSVVHDGSLPPTGFEINTAPAGGDLYVKQITDICKKLTKAKAEVNNQCGLHVHLDARDYNFYDIRRLVKVYAAIEPALFLMVPAHRRNSKYCTRCADKFERAIKSGHLSHKEIKESVVVGTYGERSTDQRKQKYPDDQTIRRTALNIHSWFYRGTIECRLLEGSVDPEQIINWGMMWAKILDFTLYSSDDEVLKTLDKSKSIESLVSIVGSERLKEYVVARHNQYKGAR